jgi:hypothetical protein
MNPSRLQRLTMKYYQVAVSSKGYQTGWCVCKIHICSAGSCFLRFCCHCRWHLGVHPGDLVRQSINNAFHFLDFVILTEQPRHKCGVNT